MDFDAAKIPLSPVLTLLGSELFLRKQTRDLLIKRALGSGLKDMNFSSFQGGEDPLDKVLNACRDFPCFAERRVVWFSEASKVKKGEAEALIQYLGDPQPSTLFLLEDEKLDGRLDWVKKLKQKSQWLEVPVPENSECLQFIRKTFENEEKKFSPEIPEKLLDWIGPNLEALQNSIRQLCLYVGDKPEVGPKDLEVLLVKVREEDIFKVVEAIFTGKKEELHRSLGALLEGGEAPLKILALVYRHLSILLSLKEAPPRRVMSLFRISPYFFKQYEYQVRRFSRRLTPSLLAPIENLDKQLKSSGLNSDLVLKKGIEDLGSLLA